MVGHSALATQAAKADAWGDVLLLDNLAVAHRATPEAHDPAGALRVLHRTTLAGHVPLDPPPHAGLPPFLYVWGDNPFLDGGVWHGADNYGVGFKWDHSRPFRN